MAYEVLRRITYSTLKIMIETNSMWPNTPSGIGSPLGSLSGGARHTLRVCRMKLMEEMKMHRKIKVEAILAECEEPAPAGSNMT
jgi:hypothetical protein